MESRNKRKLIMICLTLSLLLITVAYAVLQTSLNIDGVVTKKGGRWDIHFANLSSPTLLGDASIENVKLQTTLFTFNVTLLKPLDTVVYTFDVVNNGNIDAVLSSFSLDGVTQASNNDVIYILRYADGKEILKGDALKAGQTRSLKLIVSYDDVEFTTEKDITLNLGATLLYSQAEKNSSSEIGDSNLSSETVSDGTEVYLNPKTGLLCDYYEESNSDYGVKTGCLKWYAFGDNGNTVNLLLDHDIDSSAPMWLGDMEYDFLDINNAINSNTKDWAIKARGITAREVLDIIDNEPATEGDLGRIWHGYNIFDPNVIVSKNAVTGFDNFPSWLIGNYYTETESLSEYYDSYYDVSYMEFIPYVVGETGLLFPGDGIVSHFGIRPVVTYTR